MKKRISNKKYKSVVGLISHLILTKPKPVRTLLKRYGIVFSPAPTRAQLIAQVVELLAENNPSFNNDLSRLIEVHIQYKGRDMLALDREQKGERLYYQEDQFLGGLLGGVAKNLIGGLFKKKNKPAGSGTTATGSNAAQIEKMKADMQRQMAEMERQRREQEERRRREEEERRRKDEASKKKQTNTLIAAGVSVVAIVGILLAVTLRSKPKQVIQQ